MKSFLISSVAIVAAVLIVAAPLRAQNVSVTASVDQTAVGLNEVFTLTVEVSGDANEPKLPDMEAFAALASTSFGQSVQIINGRISTSRTYQYTFFARAAGKFAINAVEVEAKGQTYRSQPIEIEIVAGAPSPTPQAPSGRSQQGEAPPNLEGV